MTVPLCACAEPLLVAFGHRFSLPDLRQPTVVLRICWVLRVISALLPPSCLGGPSTAHIRIQ